MTDPRSVRRSKAGRRGAGLVRVEVWIPVDVAADLGVLCQAAAEVVGLPPERCRTQAIIAAIQATCRRLRHASGSGGT